MDITKLEGYGDMPTYLDPARRKLLISIDPPPLSNRTYFACTQPRGQSGLVGNEGQSQTHGKSYTGADHVKTGMATPQHSNHG